MIKGLCKEGLVDDAEELLRRMEGNGCTPNKHSYNVFFAGTVAKI